jgi:predicted enzyme related to lactoylglutathione lyase
MAWEFEDLKGYMMIRNRGRSNGGLVDMRGKVPDAVPAHWNAYFSCADLDATLETARQGGASVLVPPIELAAGRFSVLRDPQGATFSVIQSPRVDD